MSHQRTTIRNALKTLLTGSSPTYATNAGTNVYTNRTNNLGVGKLPAILIYDNAESATPRDIRSTQYIRKLETKISAIVEANSGYDSAVDDLCLQIENLLKASRSISGTATSSVLLNTELSFEGTGDKILATATLTYEIQYIA